MEGSVDLEVRKDVPEEIGADEDEVNEDEGFKLEVRKGAPEETDADEVEVEVEIGGVGLIVGKVQNLRGPFRPPPASF